MSRQSAKICKCSDLAEIWYAASLSMKTLVFDENFEIARIPRC
jgi:hypothetical protein